MASSHRSSSGPDWKGIAEQVCFFEDQNRVRLEISIARWTTNGAPDLSLTGKCWEPEADRRVAKPLAFTNVICRAEQLKTLEGLVTFLLYQLDFQLGEHEWESAGKDSA